MHIARNTHEVIFWLEFYNPVAAHLSSLRVNNFRKFKESLAHRNFFKILHSSQNFTMSTIKMGKNRYQRAMCCYLWEKRIQKGHLKLWNREREEEICKICHLANKTIRRILVWKKAFSHLANWMETRLCSVEHNSSRLSYWICITDVIS